MQNQDKETLLKINRQYITALTSNIITFSTLTHMLNGVKLSLNSDGSSMNVAVCIKKLHEVTEILENIVDKSPIVPEFAADGTFDKLRDSVKEWSNKTDKEIVEILKSKEYLNGVKEE